MYVCMHVRIDVQVHVCMSRQGNAFHREPHVQTYTHMRKHIHIHIHTSTPVGFFLPHRFCLQPSRSRSHQRIPASPHPRIPASPISPTIFLSSSLLSPVSLCAQQADLFPDIYSCSSAASACSQPPSFLCSPSHPRSKRFPQYSYSYSYSQVCVPSRGAYLKELEGSREIIDA
jgi:hypothetical protein